MHTRPTVRQTLALVAPLLMALTAALFSPPASAQISEEQARQVRSLLADSHWVAEGPENPERVAYMFTDMECPYCARQWQAMRPFINDADNVTQVRHVIVGILKPQSHAKGAAVRDSQRGDVAHVLECSRKCGAGPRGASWSTCSSGR